MYNVSFEPEIFARRKFSTIQLCVLIDETKRDCPTIFIFKAYTYPNFSKRRSLAVYISPDKGCLLGCTILQEHNAVGFTLSVLVSHKSLLL
jgi:hypothetical protein